MKAGEKFSFFSFNWLWKAILRGAHKTARLCLAEGMEHKAQWKGFTTYSAYASHVGALISIEIISLRVSTGNIHVAQKVEGKYFIGRAF